VLALVIFWQLKTKLRYAEKGVDVIAWNGWLHLIKFFFEKFNKH
jgi:hypothetical protein